MEYIINDLITWLWYFLIFLVLGFSFFSFMFFTIRSKSINKGLQEEKINKIVSFKKLEKDPEIIKLYEQLEQALRKRYNDNFTSNSL